MENRPIDGLMKTAMESIKEMVDVNTIVGDAVQTPDGTVIIPVSKVSFGFAAGGGEYNMVDNSKKEQCEQNEYPFAGGSGAGVSINPVAFMVVGKNNVVKLMSPTTNSSVDKLMDFIPNLMDKMDSIFNDNKKSKESKENKNNKKKIIK